MSQMAITDRERGFLDAVLADPSDDFPRLVYADWLEDEGRVERADFIRLQVELAGCRVCNAKEGPAWDWSCGHKELRRRERELLGRNGPWWVGFPVRTGQTKHEGPIPTVAIGLRSKTTLDAECEFRRGFVASVSLTLADFMTHAGAIFAAAPVEEVRLTDREPLSLLSTRHIPGEPWYGWYAWGDARLRLPHSTPEGAVYALPPALFAWLGGRRAGGNPYDRYYPGRDQAVADLCRACIAYGREKAGLPALPHKEAVSR
jgi:uncharacterized protein (TIGR02996 family)